MSKQIEMAHVLEYLDQNDLMGGIDIYIPHETIREIEKVLAYGDILYPFAPWMEKDASYHLTHAMDHLRVESKNPEGRDESSCHHVAHAIVRLMFYLAHKQEAV